MIDQYDDSFQNVPVLFSAFYRILTSSAYVVQVKQSKQLRTNQQNLSIIGRDKIYISSKKREMQIILFDKFR